MKAPQTEDDMANLAKQAGSHVLRLVCVGDEKLQLLEKLSDAYVAANMSRAFRDRNQMALYASACSAFADSMAQPAFSPHPEQLPFCHLHDRSFPSLFSLSTHERSEITELFSFGARFDDFVVSINLAALPSTALTELVSKSDETHIALMQEGVTRV